MASQLFFVDQQLNINSIPHWVCAQVKVFAEIEQLDELGEFWGSAFRFSTIKPIITGAELERIEVYARSESGEFEELVYDDTIINAASKLAINIAMDQAEGDVDDFII